MEPENITQEAVVAEQKSQLHQVTPLSKYLALALFIILPFIGGYIGYTFAPERVVEVEKVVIKEVEVSVGQDEKSLENDTISLVSFTHPTVGYRFSYPENWRIEHNGEFVQLSNYPDSGIDQTAWTEGQNKIEGGYVQMKTDITDWSEYASVQYGNKIIYTKKSDGGWRWTSFALQFPNDTDKVITFTIYGDTDNFEAVLEVFLRDFIFLSAGA